MIIISWPVPAPDFREKKIKLLSSCTVLPLQHSVKTGPMITEVLISGADRAEGLQIFCEELMDASIRIAVPDKISAHDALFPDYLEFIHADTQVTMRDIFSQIL